jgi:hypothetical protein
LLLQLLHRCYLRLWALLLYCLLLLLLGCTVDHLRCQLLSALRVVLLLRLLRLLLRVAPLSIVPPHWQQHQLPLGKAAAGSLQQLSWTGGRRHQQLD